MKVTPAAAWALLARLGWAIILWPRLSASSSRVDDHLVRPQLKVLLELVATFERVAGLLRAAC